MIDSSKLHKIFSLLFYVQFASIFSHEMLYLIITVEIHGVLHETDT